MSRSIAACTAAVLALVAGAILILTEPRDEARADDRGGRDRAASPFPHDATFTTLITASLPTFGLAGDRAGRLYVSARSLQPGAPGLIWRVDPRNPSLVLVGTVPAASGAVTSSLNGLALDAAGDVFVAEGVSGRVFKLTPDAASPPSASVFGTGLPGSLTIAFDRSGALWVTDGVTNQGRVWRVPPTGGAGVEVFRIPPLTNDLGVGRGVTRSPVGPGLPPTVGLSVATGLAFEPDGDLLVSDLARGAIWKVEFNRDGSLKSPTGCDETYTAPNTLCLSNVLIAHPLITAAGQIALDRAGNIWVSVVDRNAIAVVTTDGRVQEIFRNPVDPTTGRRNSADASVGNDHILEFPTVPVLIGDRFYVANLDSDVQDNSPNSGGELSGEAGAAGPLRGKISCMDQDLLIPGMRLPVGADGHGRDDDGECDDRDR